MLWNGQVVTGCAATDSAAGLSSAGAGEASRPSQHAGAAISIARIESERFQLIVVPSVIAADRRALPRQRARRDVARNRSLVRQFPRLIVERNRLLIVRSSWLRTRPTRLSTSSRPMCSRREEV